MQQTADQSSWIAYLPLIAALAAALIASATSLAVLAVTKKMDKTRLLKTCATALSTEISFVLANLTRLRDQHDGKTYLEAEFLTSPEQLMWCYRGLAQYIGVLNPASSNGVVEFYSRLAMLSPEDGAIPSCRFSKEEVAEVITAGEAAVMKLKSNGRKVKDVIEHSLGPAH